MTALEEALEAGDVAAGMNAVPWDKLAEMKVELTPELKNVLDKSAAVAAKMMPKGISIIFNKTNPEAVAWVEARCAELITQNIIPESRAAIRDIMLRAFNKGIPPRSAARLIREHIGILPRHAEAVNKYYASLVEELGEEEALRLAEKYAQKLINYRAKNIARTETIRASSQGQHELWRQAVEEDLLDPNEWERVWIADETERVCGICQGLEGQRAPMDGPFPGGYMMPPDPHPSCRCAVGLQRKEE
jgi:SPP1 gp7 family putative phage head morphogenesis protein